MRAVYFEEHGGYDVVRVGQVPEPKPGPGEVVIRVKAAAINYNDIWARRGLPRLHVPMPHISGSDASGVVVDVGPQVRTLAVGDEVVTYPVKACRQCSACLAGQEVFCKHMEIWGFQTGPYDGSYAEYAVVQAAQCLPKPTHLSWTDAAAVSSALLSVYRMLVTRAQAKAGETVLVWGASGGTGSMAIKLAKLLGCVVIAVTSSEAKEAFCYGIGADHVILPQREDVKKRVKQLTGRRGVDLVFDHVGEPVWKTSIECLKWGGRIVICGATEGFSPTIDLRFLWNKQLTFIGSHIGTHGEFVECMRLVNAKTIAPAVTEVYGLDDVTEAQQKMEARQIMGRIAVAVDL